MSQLTQRNVSHKHNNHNKNDSRSTPHENAATSGVSDEEMEPLPSVPSGEQEIPQDTGNIEVLDSALKDLNPKMKNWIVRGILGCIMISSFSFIIYLGPLAITLLVLAIQIKCFHEIITIGHVVYQSNNLPWFRTISWFFLVASN